MGNSLSTRIRYAWRKFSLRGRWGQRSFCASVKEGSVSRDFIHQIGAYLSRDLTAWSHFLTCFILR